MVPSRSRRHSNRCKLINTSLFATDWYIDQMKRATYDAPPIPSQLTHDLYKFGSLDVAYYFDELRAIPKDATITIQKFMRWIESQDSRTFYDLDGEMFQKKYCLQTTFEFL